MSHLPTIPVSRSKSACFAYPGADHSECPSSVECFHAVPAPSMGEVLKDLVAPGRVIGFRTDAGYEYEATIYTAAMTIGTMDAAVSGHRVALHLIADDRPVLMAEGLAKGAHDPKRDVWAITVDEPSGRCFRTSTVVEAWLSYDATLAAEEEDYACSACDEQLVFSEGRWETTNDGVVICENSVAAVGHMAVVVS